MDKKYLKQVGMYLLASIVSVGMILYIGYHLFYGLTQKVEKEPATVSTIYSVVETEVYLFRAEEVLYSSGTSGSVVPAVADGTRVGIGDTVARRYDASMPDTVSEIAQLDMQIARLTEMQSHALSVRDTAAIDREIYGIMQKIASSARRGDAAEAMSHRADLRAALTKRSVVTGAVSDVEGELARLNAERNALMRELGACRETVTMKKSGYYYAVTDGYETCFTPDVALSMTVEAFSALRSESAASVSTSAVGKLVTDYVWYAACIVPTADATHFTEAQSYPVSFPYNGETTVTMTLARAVKDGERTMLVFSASVMPQGFTYSRLQPAVITDHSYTGYFVPSTAVRVVDGVTGVYVLSGSVVHYRAVQLLVEGDDRCLLAVAPEEDPPEGYTWLQQSEMVITKGRGLSEGRILS